MFTLSKSAIESIKLTAATVAAIITAASVAPVDAMPIETSNSPIFKNDYTVSGGLDYRVNGGVIKSTPRYLQTGTNAILTKTKDGKFVDADHVEVDAKHVTTRCNAGSILVKALCEIAINPNVTGYGQGAVRTGGNTAIFGGYDSSGKKVYGGAAVRLDNLALTAGYDGNVTGSVAYSVGSFSPFVAYQRNITNYGLEYRPSDNLALVASTGGSGNYAAGLRFDIGSGGGTLPKPVVKPVASQPLVIVPAPVYQAPEPMTEYNEPAVKMCPPGFRSRQGICAKKIAPKYIRGRG